MCRAWVFHRCPRVLTDGAIIAVVAALGLTRDITNTLIFTVSMDLSRPHAAGSDFTLLSTWGYTLAIGAASLGPVLADAIGYAGAVAASVGLSVGALISVSALFTTRFASTDRVGVARRGRCSDTS